MKGSEELIAKQSPRFDPRNLIGRSILFQNDERIDSDDESVEIRSMWQS